MTIQTARTAELITATAIRISNNQFCDETVHRTVSLHAKAKEAMLEAGFYPYREEALDWEFYLR